MKLLISQLPPASSSVHPLWFRCSPWYSEKAQNKYFSVLCLSGLLLALPWLRWLVANMLPKSSGFDPGPVFVGFVMEEWHWNGFSLSALVFHC